jgi:hypothetical protein
MEPITNSSILAESGGPYPLGFTPQKGETELTVLPRSNGELRSEWRHLDGMIFMCLASNRAFVFHALGY